jgi:hypothetical protein
LSYRNFDVYLDYIRPLEKKVGKATHIVRLEESFFKQDYAFRAFEELGCEYPTYLALTYLFSRIPFDQYIVTGDGDLDRDGSLFVKIALKHQATRPTNSISVPVASSSIAYRIWAQANKRRGEYYFFSSTPELIASVADDPSFRSRYPQNNAKDLLYRDFPQIARRPKTTNWENGGDDENRKIRRALEIHAATKPGLAHYQAALGTRVCVDTIYKKPIAG